MAQVNQGADHHLGFLLKHFLMLDVALFSTGFWFRTTMMDPRFQNLVVVMMPNISI